MCQRSPARVAKGLFHSRQQPATCKAKKIISQEIHVNDQGLTCKAVVGFHPRWRREETVVTQRTTAHIARKIRQQAVHVCSLLSCSLEQEIEVNDLSIGKMRKPTDILTQQSRLHGSTRSSPHPQVNFHHEFTRNTT